jgi:hypothetical protein
MGLIPELQQALDKSSENFYNPVFGLVSSDFRKGSHLGSLGLQLPRDLEQILRDMRAESRAAQAGNQHSSKPAEQ